MIMKPTRRELLPILTATPALFAGPRKFFTDSEYAAVDALTAILLPSEPSSPGAREAQVPAFLDYVLRESEPARQQAFRRGLTAVDAQAQSRFGKLFASCMAEQQDAIVAELAARESAPASELDEFFVLLKRLTLEGYLFSPVSYQHFGYRGDHAVAGFTGCTHPEHQPKPSTAG